MGENDDNLLDMSVDHQLDEGLCDDSIGSAITISKEQKDVGIQNVVVMLDSAVQTCTMIKEDAEVQAMITTEEASTDINQRLLNNARPFSTMTGDLNSPATQFSIGSIKHDDKAILFYIGFPSYILLLICFSFLGPVAMVLCYDKRSIDPEVSFVGCHRALAPINEFFLALLAQTSI